MNKIDSIADCCEGGLESNSRAIPLKKKLPLLKTKFWQIFASLLLVVFIVTQIFQVSIPHEISTLAHQYHANQIERELFPSNGVLLPLSWDGFGARLAYAGVIDPLKIEKLYERPGLNEFDHMMWYGSDPQKITVSQNNSQTILNAFWAFGLANENPVLSEGPMVNPAYGGVDRFASTGGWTLASTGIMDHYGQHKLVVLDDDEQALVEKVARNIYRSCCDNSTYFPDCNHGMAMLGLLEMLAVNGATEEEMYKEALQMNVYWFPDTYRAIAQFMKERRGQQWREVDPKVILSQHFSSASGYQGVLAELNTRPAAGSSCSV